MSAKVVWLRPKQAEEAERLNRAVAAYLASLNPPKEPEKPIFRVFAYALSGWLYKLATRLHRYSAGLRGR